ncbi:hypothetical protein [Streptomyces katrae]|uniref:hypothetical protein n=1 Tax=Streptomyces katrae TaxID=68223 RepID=UPI0012FEC1D9|nr:hypothetical protein [Streptomyces katrae]
MTFSMPAHQIWNARETSSSSVICRWVSDVVNGRVELGVTAVRDHGRRPFGEGRPVGAGDAEQVGGDGQRQRDGEVGDQVGRGPCGQAGGQVRGDGPYAVAHRFGSARGEGRGGEATQALVAGAVPG